ncbi:MAG: zinc metallopeptidase [Bacilli bacterium]|nr:zinc metallopeptidase [Bacilli bacterium]
MDYFIYYGLTLIAFLITVGAQVFISCTFNKYKKVANIKGKSGGEIAREILDKYDLKNIYVVETKGNLTDHYDPNRKVIRLSTDVYNKESIASLAVAAHECGHALQDKDNYVFLKIRAALVPIVNISSKLGYVAIVIGLITSMLNLIWIGIGLEAVILIFQIITLPVEIDASKRALRELEEMNALEKDELQKGKVVLVSAALTYVASVAATVLELLRLVLIYGDRD